MLTSVEAIVQNGIVTFLEPLELQEGTQMIVTLLPPTFLLEHPTTVDALRHASPQTFKVQKYHLGSDVHVDRDTLYRERGA
ncbi:MAG: hypothetical protein HQM11_14925 [SAR324 cluster bacterium]|nr:hypothetical protein [SAR324 cluster bacterium]